MDRVLRLDGGTEGPTAAILQKLRLIVSGGAPLDGKLFDVYARAGLTIHEGYGLTEAGPIVTVNPLGGSRRGSVGLPLPGVELRIDGASASEEGEILVRGPTVMRGYLDRPELTAQVLHDGWLHTGDLGRVDIDGYLTITGRRRDLIVTGAGKNVYPAEVEDLYAELPHTLEFAVVGVPSARTLGEEVHGIAVLSSATRDLDLDEVTDLIRQQVYAVSRDLPTYQRIAQVHVWHRPLPRIDDGRVDRAALRTELERGGDVADGVDIADSLAPWERDIYQRVSGLSGLAVAEVVAQADSPLDTLVNSLMAVELVAGLQRGDADPIVFDRMHMTLRQFIDEIGSHAHQPIPDVGPDGGSRTYWFEAMAAAELPAAGKRPVTSAIIGGLIRGLRSVQVIGADELPEDRPYLLAASATGRVSLATALAALGQLTDNICILVEREQDLGSNSSTQLCRRLADRVVLADYHGLEVGLLSAVARLGRRSPLLMFPEGLHGTAEPGAGAFKSGIGMVALELGVSIIPLHLHATDGTTHIRLGAAIDPGDFAVRQSQLTSYEVYREIAAAARARLRDLAKSQEAI
jgi:long-chain acyl-CoA synthetase